MNVARAARQQVLKGATPNDVVRGGRVARGVAPRRDGARLRVGKGAQRALVVCRAARLRVRHRHGAAHPCGGR
eukprot:5464441-Prymnesium_polylepis.1